MPAVVPLLSGDKSRKKTVERSEMDESRVVVKVASKNNPIPSLL